jgi:hypothetical protein
LVKPANMCAMMCSLKRPFLHIHLVCHGISLLVNPENHLLAS